MKNRFQIHQTAPDLPDTWAGSEVFYWDQEIVAVLKRDRQFLLLKAAYDSIDWDTYYERLKGTPFYAWKRYGSGFLTLAGPGHLEQNQFFSAFGEISKEHEDFLKENPEFNQVMHDLHVEIAGKMIESLLKLEGKKSGKKEIST